MPFERLRQIPGRMASYSPAVLRRASIKINELLTNPRMYCNIWPCLSVESGIQAIPWDTALMEMSSSSRNDSVRAFQFCAPQLETDGNCTKIEKGEYIWPHTCHLTGLKLLNLANKAHGRREPTPKVCLLPEKCHALCPIGGVCLLPRLPTWWIPKSMPYCWPMPFGKYGLWQVQLYSTSNFVRDAMSDFQINNSSWSYSHSTRQQINQTWNGIGYVGNLLRRDRWVTTAYKV